MERWLPHDIEACCRADLDFHFAILAASHNHILQQLIGSIGAALMSGFRLSTHLAEFYAATLSAHAEVLDRIRQHDSDGARTAMLDILAIAADDLVPAMQHAPRTTRDAGKPHASRFTPADFELALKAARLMGMQVMRPVSEAATTLAAKLPKGRVFASGRGFVPFVKPKVFEALLVTHADPQNQVEGGDAGEAAETDGPIGGDDNGAQSSDADLGEGAVVLAPYGPLEGWWEAVIIKAKGELFTLKRRDYPDDPVFARRRNQLVLIPPGVAA